MKKLFIASLVLFTFSSCSDENLNPTEVVQNKVTRLQTNYLLSSNYRSRNKTTTNFIPNWATTVEVINTNSMIATNAKTNATSGKLLLILN
jgi:hypothetical protein